MRAFVLASLLAAGCVRAPAPLDIQALIAKRGAEEARRDLAIRVIDDPRDVQARLALAALAEQVGRPSEAIEQLEAVERLGGPLGTRWHAEDRKRLARLLLARGRARLVRGAPSSLPDLERAAKLGGAAPSIDELISAQIAVASTLVRHVDAKVRARGRAILAAHAMPAAGHGDPTEESAWLGARANATPAERGTFGAWLWSIGARREAYDQLAVWHTATVAPRDQTLQSAYLRAFAWWVPLWLGDAPPPPAADLVGPERCRFPGADCAPPQPEVAPLPAIADLDAALVDPVTAAAARYAATRGDNAAGLIVVAKAYARDPSVAERLARDVVARAPDAALAHATIGALYDALGDAPRARAAWQEAVALSDEAAFVQGLADATGRAGDGSAALVFATQAGAASGDPAVVWNAVAAALLSSSQYVETLTAARSALDLAGPDELPRALDLAIAASRALGRTSQADALGVQRAQVSLAHGATQDSDALAAIAAHELRPTAVSVARLWVAARAYPRDIEVRAALLASLDVDDARRPVVVRELLELAGDPSSDRALAAVIALRAAR